MNTALDVFRRAQFSMTDIVRRAQGDAVGNARRNRPRPHGSLEGGVSNHEGRSATAR